MPRSFKRVIFMIWFMPGEGLSSGNENEDIFKCVPSRLLKSPTQDNNKGNELFFRVNIQ